MIGQIIWLIMFIILGFQTTILVKKYSINEAALWKNLVLTCSGWLVLIVFLFIKEKIHILWVYSLVWLVVSILAWQRSKTKKGGEDWIRLR